MEQKEITVEARDAGKRLDAFLHEQLPEFSRSRLQVWIKEGRVLVGGGKTRTALILRGGEIVTVEPGAMNPLHAEAEELPLDVLYEDDDIVVIDKAAGVVVHAGAGHTHGTLVNALLHHFGKLSTLHGDVRPGIVHRLDRETSGVLVVARTDRAHQSLAKQFHDREVEKSYLALVQGRMKHKAERIDMPIARDPVRRTRMTTKLANGRRALTEFRVLEEWERMSFLDVRIHTGRTHQIRVHLASIGHPIVGDRLYGAAVSSLGRFFLHAHRLKLRLPATGEWKTFESPLAPELAAYLDSLRGNAAKMVSS